MRCRWVTGAVLVCSAALILSCRDGSSQASKPLVCHVGGTMLPVMEELARMYQAETGQAVELNSADSGALLARIDLEKAGDLYVCHDPFMDLLMTKFRMGVDAWTVAELTPVIVVPKGNPQGIRGLADLARPEVRLALTDFEHSTLGWMLPEMFRRAGIDLGKLAKDKRITLDKSGGYVANMVKMNNADAGVVWNAVAWLRRDALDAVAIPAEHLPAPGVDAITSATGRVYALAPVRVTIATLACSSRPEAARRFAEFVGSDRASKVFRDQGFTGCAAVQEHKDGQAITRGKTPLTRHAGSTRLRMYAGAGLRPALDELAAAFAETSSVQIDVDYGGSGVLIGRVEQDGRADLFMPGDAWYVDQLQQRSGRVASRATVAWLVPVIIVAKGNPKRVTGVADLFRADVSAAVGNAEAAQIGRATDEILAKHDLDRAKLRSKESVTVNELGVWVKMGSADAAIVWDAIAAGIADSVDVVEIPREKNVISEVVVGLITTSGNREAARQFMAFMSGREGRAILRAKGYRVDVP